MAFDAEDGATVRAAQSTAYKANRAHADHSPIASLAPLKEVLDVAGVRWCEQLGVEADDVLASLAVYAAAAGRESRPALRRQGLLRPAGTRRRPDPGAVDRRHGHARPAPHEHPHARPRISAVRRDDSTAAASRPAAGGGRAPYTPNGALAVITPTRGQCRVQQRV